MKELGARVMLVLLGLLVCPTLSNALEATPEGDVLVLFDLENRGSKLSGAQLEELNAHLYAGLGQGGRFQLVPRAKLKESLAGKSCPERQCQMTEGAKLGAAYSVSARLGQIGKLCIISASLYRSSDGVALRTSTERSSCQPDDLRAALDLVAIKLRARSVSGRLPPPDEQSSGASAQLDQQPRLMDDRAPETPAPPVQPRPLVMGPDRRPVAQHPDVEALPRKMNQPIVSPKDSNSGPEWREGSAEDMAQGQTGQALAKDTTLRRFLSLSLVYASPYLAGSDELEDSVEDRSFVGARTAFDYRMGRWTLLGLSFTGLIADNESTADINARFGGLFDLADGLSVLAFAEGGMSVWAPAEGSVLYGVGAGLGLGGRWLLAGNFGVQAEVSAGMQVLEDSPESDSDADPRGESLFLWRVQAHLGLVVGW